MPMDAAQARATFGKTWTRVASGKERVIIRRRGKPVAVIVPNEDLALIEQREDQLDIEAVRKALAEPGESIPYEKLRRQMGLR